jgi:hypothetical protein
MRKDRRQGKREQEQILLNPVASENDVYKDLRGVPVPLTVFLE